MLTYLSPVDIVKDKVKLLCSLEGVIEPNQEGMFEAFQEHIPLSHDVLLLIKKKRNHLEFEHEAKADEQLLL